MGVKNLSVALGCIKRNQTFTRGVSDILYYDLSMVENGMRERKAGIAWDFRNHSFELRGG